MSEMRTAPVPVYHHAKFDVASVGPVGRIEKRCGCKWTEEELRDLRGFEAAVRLDELKRLPHRHGYGRCELCERMSRLGGVDLTMAGGLGCLK